MSSTIHFTIIETNETDHSVVARYYTDMLGPMQLGPDTDPETGEVLTNADGSPVRIRTDYSIGVPADMVIDATSQPFIDFIMSYAPQSFFDAVEGKLNGQVGDLTPLLHAYNTFEEQATVALQLRLDAWARGKGYDHLLSLCTYATSPNAQFAAEGQRGVDERDRTWTQAYQLMADVKAGTRPQPTLDELAIEIPAPSWGTV